ncbi:MAG TPA: tRNA (5-methylaminomethyl-2-thiouridine)(34)-methyltransferase MnmD [Chitinophagaceae bacterium]|nr:tRNA (5-methylaminomethyl-2-thiouridine)(34)-methyltransferase MnmD [Chitinophagaceae bacterium]
MQRKIVITGDGSHTVEVPELGVSYHSRHGAIAESIHVFIRAGLAAIAGRRPVHIMEIGFGTGLNALLTLIESEKTGLEIHYTAIEPFPLGEDEVRQLNYCAQLGRPELQPVFDELHRCEWEKTHRMNPGFGFTKIKSTLQDYSATSRFDLVYYDAFAPSAQPELWTQEIFEKLYTWMSPGGILVTYCSKGSVRRAMQAAGFLVEKLPGPVGKREMVRAAPRQPSPKGEGEAPPRPSPKGRENVVSIEN